MSEEKKTGIKKFFDDKSVNLKKRYRVVVTDNSTHHPVLHLMIQGFEVAIYPILATIAIVAITVSIIVFTPIKEHIPGFLKTQVQQQAIDNAIKLDSLEREVELRDLYLNNIKMVLSGSDSVFRNNNDIKIVRPESIQIKPFNHDSIFREKLENEKYNLTMKIDSSAVKDISGLLLFTPSKGEITSKFNNLTEHYGIDIAIPTGATVASTLDGVVILSEYTINTGYVIVVQHEADIISIYKHNSELLKKIGDHVKTGEIIALAGNSGEVTTGSHLHFEIWVDGKPVDPQQYINF